MTLAEHFLMHPQLASEWNDPRSPETLSRASAYRAQWKCQEGHEWDTPVSERTRTGRSPSTCPTCSQRQRFYDKFAGEELPTGKNVIPELAAFYNGRTDGSEAPVAQTSKRVLCNWKCPQGHEWVSRPFTMQKNPQCPDCQGSAKSARNTPLEQRLFKNSELYALVIPEKREEASQAYSKSRQRTICECSQGHQWETTYYELTKRQGECPYCAHRKPLAGFNDLSVTHPQLWAQCLDKTQVVLASSYREVSWGCALGHQWKAPVSARALRGNDCPYCKNKKLLVGFNDLLTAVPQVIEHWALDNTFSPSDIISGSDQQVSLICSNDTQHRLVLPAYVVNRKRMQEHLTFFCSRCQTSQGEFELGLFLEELVGSDKLVKRDRSVIAPKELDFYIPSRSIAIEFNGLYWHSEAMGKGSSYHFNKWRACHEAGIQLITIWEDDWRDKSRLIKEMLTNKLGLSQGKRVYARKTSLVEVPAEEAREFLVLHHIQGFSQGNKYFGLKSQEEELVAVMGFSVQADRIVQLNRFATSHHVPGGFSKLLKHLVKETLPAKVVTFADHEVSDGHLYASQGFTAEAEVAPDYMYVVQSSRVHKFNYRKARFKRDENLLWEEGLTETELAELNGLSRVWDSGKTRYVLSSF